MDLAPINGWSGEEAQAQFLRCCGARRWAEQMASRRPFASAAALLAAAEEYAKARGAVELRLEVRPDNARALHLYEASGYRSFARLGHYYEDGADALRMRRYLV